MKGPLMVRSVFALCLLAPLAAAAKPVGRPEDLAHTLASALKKTRVT
jgi:hypothetical protein